MSIVDRAAQFAPFSALTGYEDVIRETGRLTDSCTELTDSSLQMLNAQLCELAENPGMAVSVTWFQPDRVKSGGSYVTAEFYNPTTGETRSECVRDYDYGDCSRDNDELYNMPFNMNTFSKLWGIKTPAEAKAKIEEQKAALNMGI